MNERDALLKAVCENPDDDTPRLVFADWLQENGEEDRAEFIRIQIQFARGNFRPSEEARLKRRLRKVEVHQPQWEQEFPAAEYIHFRGGFIERATLLDGNDLEKALAAAPLRSVGVRGPVDLIAVLTIPILCRVESLDLESAKVRKADVEAFIERDWPSHPGRLYLPSGSAPRDLRERVLSRFGSWVYL
jgi:uncharacterized protein (TIGR02996 family)